MPDKNRRSVVPKRDGGVFNEIAMRVKLIWRLMRDRRVNPLLKLLPIASLFYLVIPDLAPGPLDDSAVIFLGSVLFVELCPEDVVREHMAALRSVVEGEWHEVSDETKRPPSQISGPNSPDEPGGESQ